MRARSQESCTANAPPPLFPGLSLLLFLSFFCFTETRVRRSKAAAHIGRFLEAKREHDQNVQIPVPPHGQRRDGCPRVRKRASTPQDRKELSPPQKIISYSVRQGCGAKRANESGLRFTDSPAQPPIVRRPTLLEGEMSCIMSYDGQRFRELCSKVQFAASMRESLWSAFIKIDCVFSV